MELLGITGNKTANVALIQNARSHKADCGRKDIIKVEGDASWLNLDVLAYLDPDISVTVIENGKAVRKEKPKPPKRLVNIVRCRNPRCISSIEEECDQIFEMSSNGKYRCINGAMDEGHFVKANDFGLVNALSPVTSFFSNNRTISSDVVRSTM